MNAVRKARSTETDDRRRGRIAFLTWFFSLFGTGGGMLALLLIGTGLVAWSSPVGVALLVVSAVGIACLAVVLSGIFRNRARSREGASR